ncbi:hypothetical protein ABZ816_19340 [Actinosynnema sp. NPDC047251]|uniref:hypothetical protein n=1 Tax=Saccharothrix espanaensis TaxID=103731 RepID=UPI0011DD5CA4|nr:hypothetical protein [Saccharothrix espanaensis]
MSDNVIRTVAEVPVGDGQSVAVGEDVPAPRFRLSTTESTTVWPVQAMPAPRRTTRIVLEGPRLAAELRARETPHVVAERA